MTDGRPPRRPRSGLWRHDDFLRFWAAQVLSAFGSRITRTALPIAAILSLAASPVQVALLSSLSVAPAVVVGLVAGGRIDRSRKRPLLVGADLVRAVLIGTVPLAAWFGLLSIVQLYAVATLVGAATVLFQITDNTYLPSLVGREHLVEGNAKLEATDSVAEISGPALAGVLIDLLTAPGAMAVDAASYLWSAIMIGRIRRAEAVPPEGAAGRVGDDLRAGLRANLSHPAVRALFLVGGVTSLSGGFFLSLYTLYALRTLGLDPATLGTIIGVGGIGGLFGAALAPRLPAGSRVGWTLVLTLAGGQLAALLIPLAAGLPRPVAIAALVAHQLAGDCLLVAYSIVALSLRQTLLPDDVLGRANAALAMVTGTMVPVGALLAGPLATAIGIPGAVWTGAILGLVAPGLLASRRDQLRH